MHAIRFSPVALDQLLDATAYYLSVHPNRKSTHLVEIIVEALYPARRFPESGAIIRPLSELTGVQYRRVNAWHYALFYRVESKSPTIVIDLVLHERSQAVQDIV